MAKPFRNRAFGFTLSFGFLGKSLAYEQTRLKFNNYNNISKYRKKWELCIGFTFRLGHNGTCTNKREGFYK
jgi:hypothetical protein